MPMSATTFAGCISLRRLTINAPRWSGSIIAIGNCAFDREGLVELFESLPSVTITKNIIITGNPGVAELTEADKAIATGKGWTLVTE